MQSPANAPATGERHVERVRCQADLKRLLFRVGQRRVVSRGERGLHAVQFRTVSGLLVFRDLAEVRGRGLHRALVTEVLRVPGAERGFVRALLEFGKSLVEKVLEFVERRRVGHILLLPSVTVIVETGYGRGGFASAKPQAAKNYDPAPGRFPATSRIVIGGVGTPGV